MARPKALIADDEAGIRRVVAGILRGAGYDTREVASGDLVLDAAREARPDLVILDLMMPGADGYAVLVQLKREPTLRDVPILLLSGAPAEVHRAIGKDLGAIDFVEKPFDAASILAAVERAAGGRARA